MPMDLDFVAMSSPFIELITLSLKVRYEDPCLGFFFGVCAARSRAFIVDIQWDSTTSKIKDWRQKYRGAYIVKVDTHPVFSADDVSLLLRTVRDNAPHKTDPTFTFVLAPDTPPTKASPGPRGKSFFFAGFCELMDTRLGKEESAAAEHMRLIGRTW
jgi:hypothetical protein